MMNPFFHIQHMGHYKLLNLETSIFGPGLFCIRMIGLVFFSYHRGQSPKEEEEGWWSALLPLLTQWANIVLKAAGFPVKKYLFVIEKNDLTSDCQLVIFTSFFLLQNKRALLRKYFAAALSSFDELYNIYSALLDIHCILRDRIAERIWTRRVDSYQAISRYDCCSPRRRWPPMDPAPQWGHSKNQFCI